MKKSFIKILAIVLLIVLCALSFTSCKSSPIKTGWAARATVGTVGDYEIAYEEIYYLASNYIKLLDAEYGDDASTSNEIITVVDENGSERSVELSEYYYERLLDLISENITFNYAVLTLAKSQGLSIDDEDIKEEIQERLDLHIENKFEGKRSVYKVDLENNHITDSLFRFTIGVDILYERLQSEYLENDANDLSDNEIKAAIKEEFIRTWHVMIIRDEDADIDTAREVLEKINSGESSMYKMIGSKYNSDFMNTTLDGYYFTKGGMDKAYEEAAYALEVGEISDIVTAMGKDNYTGNTVPCYYIIQRLSMESAYIDQHFEALKADYIESVVYDKVEEQESKLSFVSNDRYDSLDLLDLKAPTQIDVLSVIIISSVLVVIAAGVGIIIFQKKKIKKAKERKRSV